MAMGVGKRTKREVEYRYYEMPTDIPVLALLGSSWIRPYGEMGPDALHFHNHLEIGYCHEGKGQLIIEEQTLSYGPGTFSIIPHNICHTTVSENGKLSYCEYLFIDVESFLRGSYQENPRFGEQIARLVNQKAVCGTAAEHPEIARLIIALIDEMREKKRFYLVSARGILLSLLIEIARRADDDHSQSEPDRMRSLIILEALNYISRGYEENIKIKTLADQCHMSETHFRRVFKQIISISPLEYINTVRVEMACNLLRTTDYAIETIARRVGYPTLTTFNRNFRRVMGCTPMQWKKNPGNYEQKLRNYRISAFEGWR